MRADPEQGVVFAVLTRDSGFRRLNEFEAKEKTSGSMHSSNNATGIYPNPSLIRSTTQPGGRKVFFVLGIGVVAGLRRTGGRLERNSIFSGPGASCSPLLSPLKRTLKKADYTVWH